MEGCQPIKRLRDKKKKVHSNFIDIKYYKGKGKVTPLQTRCGPEGG
jgi:hypothetical protein